MRLPFYILIPLTLIGLVVFLTFKNSKESLACGNPDSTGEIQTDQKYAIFEGKKVSVPELADTLSQSKILGSTSGEEKWIEVDLSEQKLRAWEGNNLFLETLVSTGLPWFPTPTGEFRIWAKVRATKMEGGSGKYYYYLPNVPYVMFIESDKIPGFRGYSLHGTYWHNDFGKVHSHGCVNLPTSVAEKLYYWANPPLPEDKKSIYAIEDKTAGTRVTIHE